jgi:hypothetical protein
MSKSLEAFIAKHIWSRREDREQISEKSKRELLRLENDSMKLRSAVNSCVSFVSSPAFKSLVDNRVLLLGEWGTGKTHLLCDITQKRLSRELPTLFILAQDIPARENPLEAIAREKGLASSGLELVERLSALGEDVNQRALLIIDGINEGDRAAWRQYITAIADQVATKQFVGLVLSCRSPFQETILTDRSAKLYVHAVHHGFAEVEFEAHIEYFHYYGIPAPGIPLLTPEFSRPLFLKLLCKSIRELRARDQKKAVRDIAAGQKGMTHVLENFVKTVGRGPEEDFGLDLGTCWRLMKGQPSLGEPGLAGLMADELSDFTARTTCRSLIRDLTGLSEDDSEDFLRALLHEGLLIETVRWDDGGYYEVVQFPYQRFGDHLICRHLLEEHLTGRDQEGVKRCFYRNRPLGRIFEIAEHGPRFKEPGLAAALMVEFPERVKRRVPEEERELLFYLPKRVLLLNPVRDAFLESLAWRTPDTCSGQTDRVITRLLNDFDENTRDMAFEVLLNLATRPRHKFSVNYLEGYLKRLDLKDRDLTWSEYLRFAPDDSVVYRLLEWVERSWGEKTDEEYVRLLLVTSSLLLTTTVRRLRDRATRALFLLGWTQPALLFEHAMKSLDWNDPYVPERMLAASYGVVMCRWADDEAKDLREALPGFAREIVDKLFLPGAGGLAHHTLISDYALGTVEAARLVDPRCIAPEKLKYLEPPLDHLPLPFVAPEEVSSTAASDDFRAIHMDFGNYTLGRLVVDRHNYQNDHEEFNALKRQILGRIYELGYSGRFEEIDTKIGRANWSRFNNEGKVDRYGKKYSWIAFFEMYGMREGAGLLEREGRDRRTSDADIDPSFPEAARDWRPEIPELFTDDSVSLAKWIESGPEPDYSDLMVMDVVDGVSGPWVLMSGYISERIDGDPRRCPTELRGLCLKESSLEALLEELRAKGSLTSGEMLTAGDDYYTFAGEIPWSSRYGGSFLRDINGKAQANIAKVNHRYEDGGWVHSAECELPTYGYAWEPYHSAVNQNSGMDYVAPALAEQLGLARHDRSPDLFDANGRPATLYREFTVDQEHFASSLLYLRFDLLERYLDVTDQGFIWLVRGERSLDADQISRLGGKLGEGQHVDAWRLFRKLFLYVVREGKNSQAVCIFG